MQTDHERLAREEAHHRFLNMLTTLHLLMRRDFGGFDDPQVRDAVAILDTHILAFAGIQRSLQISSLSGMLDVPMHFGRLCAQLTAVLLAPRGVACEFFADEGDMASQTGEKLGLILVELVTNAAKHAFCGRARGHVSITISREDDGWRCVVQDDGSGFGGGVGGSGRGLIEGLARSIDAQVITSSSPFGVKVVVDLPEHPFRAGRGRMASCSGWPGASPGVSAAPMQVAV